MPAFNENMTQFIYVIRDAGMFLPDSFQDKASEIDGLHFIEGKLKDSMDEELTLQSAIFDRDWETSQRLESHK